MKDAASRERPTVHDFDRRLLDLAKRLPIAKMFAGSRMLGYYSTTIVGSPAAASETVVCTTQPFNPPADYDIVFLVGWVCFTVGTNGVSSTIKIRQGSGATGTTVAASGATTRVATNVNEQAIVGVDTLMLANDFQYSLTLTIGSGSAASTVSAVALLAFCT